MSNCTAANWIAPYITYQMMRSNQFGISVYTFIKYTKEALNSYLKMEESGHLPERFFTFVHSEQRPESFKADYFFKILTDELHLFQNGPQLQLTHQHFRDCLAAIYLFQIAESSDAADGLPAEWRESFGQEIMGFLADLLQTEEAPGSTWKKMWAFTRQESDGGLFVKKLLELHKLAYGRDFSGIDFSALYLSKVSLSGCQLSGSRNHFRGTTLSRDTFLGNGHQMKVISVSWSPSGTRFLSASHDCTIRIWNGETSVLLENRSIHSHYIRCARWNPKNEDQFASSGDDKDVFCWQYSHTEKQWCPKSIGRSADWTCGMSWSPDGAKIVCGDRSGGVMLFSSDGLEPPRCFQSVHADHVHCIAWSAYDEPRFATGSDDGIFCIWNPHEDAPLYQGLSTPT